MYVESGLRCCWIMDCYVHNTWRPGFPVLSPHVYKYLTTQQYTDLCIKDADVHDPAVHALLMKVYNYIHLFIHYIYMPYMVLISLPQINSAETESELRFLFTEEEISSLVLETGYRVALPCLKLAARPTLWWVLRDYHTLIKVLTEIDQFAKGLDEVGVLKYMCNFPELMRPLFVTDVKKRIDKGVHKYIKVMFGNSY